MKVYVFTFENFPAICNGDSLVYWWDESRWHFEIHREDGSIEKAEVVDPWVEARIHVAAERWEKDEA